MSFEPDGYFERLTQRASILTRQAAWDQLTALERQSRHRFKRTQLVGVLTWQTYGVTGRLCLHFTTLDSLNTKQVSRLKKDLVQIDLQGHMQCSRFSRTRFVWLTQIAENGLFKTLSVGGKPLDTFRDLPLIWKLTTYLREITVDYLCLPCMT
jgi:hypothetical protein